MAAISWKDPSNGVWGAAANWSTGAAPSLTDNATISASGSYTVTISSIDVANSLTFDAPQASLVETAAELIMVGRSLSIRVPYRSVRRISWAASRFRAA
jgi:hypothetical protein